MNLFADIIIPIAIPGTYTYRIPDRLQQCAAAGKRAIVPLGTKKLYSGLITNLKRETNHQQVKDIVDIIDDIPVVHPLHLQFWQWICKYYLCFPGEVMHAAFPAGLRFDSETHFSLLHKQPSVTFSPEEMIVIEALRHKSCTLKDIQKLLSKQNVYPIIRKLIHEGIITSDEVLRHQYKARSEIYYMLENTYTDQQWNDLINQWDKRATRQLELLEEIFFHAQTSPLVSKKKLMEKFSDINNPLKKLIEKGLIKEIVVPMSRLHVEASPETKEITLTRHQQMAYRAMQETFLHHDVVLLHGITSSGKTYLYLKLIEEMLQHKMQVLYLLPEIALTAQIIRKLQAHFGHKVGVYHSKFNAPERVEIWNKVLKGEYQVVLGARSALFLPFQQLGLIIVDEEHDGSYKQQDPAPRYHARDAAVMLGKITDAKVLLGTATPSLESYKNAQDGKYGLVELKERFLGYQLPEVIVVNTSEAQRKRQMRAHFAQVLIDEIQNTLARKEQVILFRNRRGYAPFIQCGECGVTLKCRHCDVSLTYHKSINKMKCHWCGYTEKNPDKCQNCGSFMLKMQGSGTQKIEDEIAMLFPHARIDRLDLDAARGKDTHEEIIEKFEQRKTDILVGTQMITKGLDFDHVRLVGVIHVDHMLSYPDFRSAERTFQLLAQVSGRAGRKDHHGRVILQTTRPQHPVIQYSAAHDYYSFYQHELAQRKSFFYPPFSRLIRITVKHKKAEEALQAALYLRKQIQLPQNVKIFGPVSPVVARVKNLYHQQILLKIPKNTALLQHTKHQIEHALQLTQQHHLLRTAQFSVDVDPY